MFLHRFKLHLDLFSFNLFTATKAVIDTSENKQIFYLPAPKNATCSAKWQTEYLAYLL